MTIVTLSRQYGSGGDEVAHQVCNLLGYSYFDKQMLVAVAAEVGLSKDEIVDFSIDSYRARTFFDHLLVGWRAPRTIAQSQVWQEELLEDFDTLLSVEQNVALVENALKTAYEQDNIVIAGRGGQAYFENRPNILHVRIVASLESCIHRVQKRQNISFSAARNLILERNRASAAYLERFYDVDWANPQLYHLVINTERLSVDVATQLIVTAVNSLSPHA